MCVVATLFLTLPYMNKNFDVAHSQPATIYHSIINPDGDLASALHHDDDRHSQLNWDSFYRYCYQPLQKSTNRIDPQMKCSHLNGLKIKWEGAVTTVEISRVHNYQLSLIRNYLPQILANWIICWYGEPSKATFDNDRDTGEFEDINRVFTEENKCNMDAWNSYEFDVTVRMQSGLLVKPTDIVLRAQHYFANFTRFLNNSDRIWFKGVLLKESLYDFVSGGRPFSVNSENNQPLVELTAIGCVKCNNPHLETFKIKNHFKLNDRIMDLYSGFKYLLNVLFNPLITFK